MKRFFLILYLFSFCTLTAYAQAPDTKNKKEPLDTPVRVVRNMAFTYGEKLKYRVHYGFMNAANIDFEVKPTNVVVAGKNTFHVIAYGKTINAFDWFMKVRDRYESNIDQLSLLPVKYFKDQLEGNYKDQDHAFFYHSRGFCIHEKGRLEIDKTVTDIISAIYYFRTFDFTYAKPGQTYAFNVYLDNELFKTSVKFLGRETLKCDIGKIRCIKLRPQLIVDRVFKDAESMTLWVTDDANHIPVRVQSELRIGTIKVDLTEYSGLRSPISKVK